MCPVCPGSPRCLFTRTVLSEFIGTPLDEISIPQQDRMKKRHEITVSPRFNFTLTTCSTGCRVCRINRTQTQLKILPVKALDCDRVSRNGDERRARLESSTRDT